MKKLIIICLLISSSKFLSQFEKVPDPLANNNPTHILINKELPAVGEQFSDLRFGTMITRATETNYIHGRHEYSRFDPFNKDKSMIILDPDVLWNIYSTASFPYNHVDNLIRTINVEEPRWDLNDSELLWGTNEFTIQTLNAVTGELSVVKDFSLDPTIGPIIDQGNAYRITMMDEGETSIDKRYWAFFLQGNDQVEYSHLYIFTWDKADDSILGIYKISANERKLDWIGMSPLGNWVLIGGDYDNQGNLAGLTMANKTLTNFHRLDYTTGHSDVGLDSDGNEVIIMQNTMTDHIDLIPIDLNTMPILEAGGSYENTNRTPLVSLFYSNESSNGLNSGIHISCNLPGYCLISTYIEPSLSEQNWLDRTIILISLDSENPEAYYLAKLYGTSGSYWEETQATITVDGSKIVWSSNWSQNIGDEEVFLMQLDMPPNWLLDLTGAIDNEPKNKINEYRLHQNYPNPFNPSTVIKYALPTESRVSLRVYDISGQEIHNQSSIETAGYYEMQFDAANISSGLYLYVIEAEAIDGNQSFRDVKKMVVLK